MTQYKLVLLLMISLIFVWFCFLFPVKPTTFSEPFSMSSGLNSILPDRQKMPLNQYMIMASCDSAYDGTNISTDQLISVISTGCRFLDFQIFYDELIGPYVGYSTDPTFEKVQGVQTVLTFKKLLTTISTNCFGGLVINSKDPVFLHFRIKSNSNDVYTKMATLIQNSITSRLYLNSFGKAILVDKNTIMKDIMGKIIIVIDRTIHPDYNVNQCPSLQSYEDTSSCIDISRFVNIETGGTNWRSLAYNPPSSVNCLTKGGTLSPIVDDTTKSLGIVMANNSSVELFLIYPPSNGNSNADPVSASTYISNLGCQTLLYRFYIEDSGLTWYKELFQVYNTAFIPMGYAVNATSTVNINTSVIL